MTTAGPAPAVALEDAEDFRGFKVVTDTEDADALAAALDGRGWLQDGDAFLRVAALLQLAGARAFLPGWGDRFDAMVAYAGEHGWSDASGEAIRAHVEVYPSAT